MTRALMKSKSRGFFYLLLLLGGGGLAALLWLRDAPAPPPEQQDLAAKPAPVPRTISASLLHLSAQQLATIPTVDGFQSPLGTAQGGFVYDAQPFGAPNSKRKGMHSGQDLNGIGGANTDLDLPVYTAARGLVVYCGTPSAAWGRTVVIAHRLPDGRVIQTLYAHLHRAVVGVGRLLARGEVIGSVGSAEGQYLAHLHYECIESRAMEAGKPGYHPAGTMNRIDPVDLMRRYPAPVYPDDFAQVRRLFIQEAQASSPQSNSTSSKQAPSLPEGSIPVNPHNFLTPLP